MRLFIRINRDTLDKYQRCPWFVPQWLGGVGLPTGDWGEIKEDGSQLGHPSDLDRRIAGRILRNWKRERPISVAHQESGWRVWRLAEKRIPEEITTVYFQRGVNTEQYDHEMGRHVVNLLFDSNYSMKDLLQEIVGSKASRAIKQNSKLWTPRAESLPEPLSDAQLLFRSRFLGLPTLDGSAQPSADTTMQKVMGNAKATATLD
jgi:hypothetical protein